MEVFNTMATTGVNGGAVKDAFLTNALREENIGLYKGSCASHCSVIAASAEAELIAQASDMPNVKSYFQWMINLTFLILYVSRL